MKNLKYYIATSLNGNVFALITDKEPNKKQYQEITEVSKEKCEKQAKETELITNYDGCTGKYLYNPVRNEFDCNYCSAGTNMGANDWGFTR